ncbi:uncharacterized protein BXZ73DRAFT_79325 [Epithele typhae]|uniref:uncharacterized protein n=1 Tax=Epithele typhae TaxID=378194 RepID=UPI002007323A|nr:uncharacterized protein BXZ73DRAFT_79325 [Epithele typhae]KAH9923919.1 hypothetical protein BXZ73DRAFT_79325 [Epithele typhae]
MDPTEARFTFPNDISACHLCGSGTKDKLKRCTGCQVVMYCGKECQKKAWPMHKSVCRLRSDSTRSQRTGNIGPVSVDESRDRILKKLGFSSAVELGHAVITWADWHKWAFSSLTKAAVMLEGGPNAMRLQTKNSKFVVFVISPYRDTEIGSNPGNAFYVRSVSVNSSEDFDPASAPRRIWAGGEDARLKDMKVWRDGHCDPWFAGLVSLIFHVHDALGYDTGMVFYSTSTLYHSPAPLPLSEFNVNVCRDVIGTIKGTMKGGAILQIKDQDVVPTPGFLQRKKRDWQWRSLFSVPGTLFLSWNHMGTFLPSFAMKSGLKPRAVMEHFATL